MAALHVFPLLTIMADVLAVLGGMIIMFLERGTDMFAYWNTTALWVVPARLPHGRGQVALLRGHRGRLIELLQRPPEPPAAHRGGWGASHDERTVVPLYDGA
jgi:hypothetical protein